MNTLGRFVIERELGRGGMGVVYLARDPRLGRQVAIKTCALPDGLSDEQTKQFRERFLREARAAASLSHPGIVTVYDAGEDESTGVPYIAMEYVPGETLKQRLEKGTRLEPARVIDFGAVLADALHVAHRAGIVHRDIKPANILIREGDGAVKIADFGVARLSSSELTRSGTSIGSPGYMSPEQVRGGEVDGRSDLFSLAVVLYESFCGRRPFHGDDLISLAYAIAHETPLPLAGSVRDCPPGLDRFFEKALSKDPDQRFADGALFRAGLLLVRTAPADAADRTVVDAVTLSPLAPLPEARTVAVPARGAIGAAAATTRVPPAERGRRRVFLFLAAAGLAAAAIAAVVVLRSDLRPAAQRRASASPVPPAIAPGTPRAAAAAPSPSPAATAPLRSTGITPREPTRSETGAETAPPVPQVPRYVRVTVPAGTEIRLILDTAVSSAGSAAGDPFTAKVAEPVLAGDRVAIPAGSGVHGIVSQAVAAKKGLGDKAGSLGLRFDRVTTQAGAAAMSATLSRTGEGSGKKTAGIVGGSAAGGALLGKALGGSDKKAAIGTLLGGAIGAGVAAGTRGADVSLPAGTALTVRIDQPIVIALAP